MKVIKWVLISLISAAVFLSLAYFIGIQLVYFGGHSSIFPTNDVGYLVPNKWKETYQSNSEYSDKNWGLWDTSLTLQSSSEVRETGYCPAFGCGMVPVAQLTITDFGASTFQTIQEWYKGRLNHTFVVSPYSETSYADGGSTIYTTRIVAGQPAYCLGAAPLPGISPLFGLGCYVLWKNHVYHIDVTVADWKNISEIMKLLTVMRSIQFN